MCLKNWLIGLADCIKNEFDGEWYINNGGCGFFALKLARLFHSIGIDAQIIINPTYGYPEDTDNTAKDIDYQTKLVYKHRCCHAYTLINEWQLDCEGYYPKSGHGYIISPDAMERAVKDPELWNDMFDRNTVPDIAARLNICFHNYVAERGTPCVT